MSADEAKLEGIDDPEVLALASRDRIVVPSDLKTMPQHFAAFLQAHGHCPGIFGSSEEFVGRFRLGQLAK
ncbi:MAG TPA: hypothetical protein VFW83_05990 [Bryobacteraceae bacterium]|nr:hypothetical protein [Bryobacteraceae bacterium]